MSSVGDRLQEALSDVGLEASDLVRKLGLTRTAVKYWLDGTTKHLRPEHLFPTAKFLGVNPEWLGTGVGEKRIELRAAEQTGAYVVQHLGKQERELLSLFASMPERKRAALLSFLAVFNGGTNGESGGS